MNTRDLSREEWLALRRQSIGASEAAAACGEDPVVSPLEFTCRKRGVIEEPDLGQIEAVRWGQLLEPAIVAETARRASLVLLERGGIEDLFSKDADTELVGFVEGHHPFLRSRARPWQTATPDGLGLHPLTGALVGIEAKNAGQYNSGAWDAEEGRAPEKFQIQVAHQLAVAPRLSGGILSGLIGGNSLRSISLERVLIVQVIEAVVAIESRIWNCIETGALPDLSGPPASVAKALKALHPDDNGESVVLPETILDVAVQFEEAKEIAREATKTVEELKSQLVAAIGNATFGYMPDGSGIYSYKTQERDEYVVKASKYRVLRFSKAKAHAKA
jgi:predicted phage-related endonuclease